MRRPYSLIFEKTLNDLFEAVCESIRSAGPDEMKDKRLIHSIHSASLSHAPQVAYYKGEFKLDNGFFRRKTLLAQYETCGAGYYLDFKIIEESVRKPIVDVLKKHEAEFGKINIT